MSMSTTRGGETAELLATIARYIARHPAKPKEAAQ